MLSPEMVADLTDFSLPQTDTQRQLHSYMTFRYLYLMSTICYLTVKVNCTQAITESLVLTAADMKCSSPMLMWVLGTLMLDAFYILHLLTKWFGAGERSAGQRRADLCFCV